VRPGVEHARALFPFFSVVKRALRGVPNARRTHYSFCVMRLLSLSSIARVKRGAESALERFEELPKEVISVFLLGVHYSHSLTETCRI